MTTKAPPSRNWLGRLRLNGDPLKVEVADAVTSGRVERTIEGASTLELTLHDPLRALLRSGLFLDPVHVTLDDRRWSLVSVRKSDDDLTLTFEPQEVFLLRRNTEPRKATRSSMTRAEFCLMLIREIKRPKIPVICPELREIQPIATSSDTGTGDDPGTTTGSTEGTSDEEREPGTDRTREDRDRDREPGMAEPSAVNFTVKGVKADREQVTVANQMLEAAVDAKAPRPVMVALIMAGIQESTLRNLTYGHSSSVGVLQLLDIHLGGSTSTSGGRRDVKLVSRLFLDRGFTGRGGAIAIYNRNPGIALDELIAQVQGNANGASDYTRWKTEAEAIVAAFDGGGTGDLSSGSADSGGRSGAYEFSRGEAGGREESTWDAIVRLMTEVGWRVFVVDGTVYMISDDRLFASRPQAVISEKSAPDWLLGLDFDFDIGGEFINGRRVPVAEANASVVADRWGVTPGSCVVIDDAGPANGRWLVHSVTQDLGARDAQVKLIKPQPKLPEPAAETTTGGSAGTGVGSSSGESSGEVRDPGRTRRGVKPLDYDYSPPGPHGAARNAFGDTEAADILCPAGTPVLAVVSGRIGDASQFGPLASDPSSVLAGQRLHLYGEDHFYYAHLREIVVRPGQQVEAGQVLGFSGVANNVPHLHFEVENGQIEDWV